MRRFRVLVGWGLIFERERYRVLARGPREAEMKALAKADRDYPHRKREPDVIRVDEGW